MIKSICFSGHRAEKIQSLAGEHYENFVEILKSILYIKLLKYIEEGFNRFYIGMSTGVDLWIGETLIELKLTQYPNIEIVAVKPFNKHGSNFSIEDKVIYKKILENASEVVCIDNYQSKYSYLTRNRYMVDHSNRLYALMFNPNSGTGYTINYAKSNGKPVDILNLENLFNEWIQAIKENTTFYHIRNYL
ncbi:MAG: SLOG family protein [Oscillospiraceae bacterium]